MLRAFIASQFKRPSGPFGIYTSNLVVKNNQANYYTMIRNLDVQWGDSILEIGYGPGIGIRMIVEACTTCTIDGIDFSQLMFKRASRLNEAYIDNGRVNLQYGDFLQAPVSQGNYAKIFCLNVIYFWNDLNTPFKRVRSLLSENGSFHIYMADKKFLIEKKTPDSVFNKYSVEEVMEALKTAGFSTVGHVKDNGHFIRATV